jgi:hypothetical protein
MTAMASSLKDAFERARQKLVAGSTEEGEKLPSIAEQPPQKIAVPVNESEVHRSKSAQSDKTRKSEVAPAPRPAQTVSFSTKAAFALTFRDLNTDPLLPAVKLTGRETQVHAGTLVDKREVVLGLDFGTSCVKVMIGDAALGKSFAVPFCKTEGIKRFLLPSRLFQTGTTYSLVQGSHAYRDLKLSLLANPDDPILQQRVIAFLALVIRRSRAWLLTEHATTYSRTGIVWKLAVGVPSAQHLQTPRAGLFERLSVAAWTVAGASADVCDSLIQTVLDQKPSAVRNDDGVEISVVPEIAAQIYGFVSSNSFDKNAPNIFLMADVGAGTVDSALFHVKLVKGGRWDFEFFTSVVEPNGVSNLHRHRVNWWDAELMKVQAPQQLLDDLAAAKLITDQQHLVPESFLDYFEGVRVKVGTVEKTPDAFFFNQRVLAQVQGKSFYRTWKDNLLPQTDLTNIPFFMCGGGMRMDFYKALAPRLASIPGCTWLKAECRILGAPADLVAEGIVEEDYDRLSVAYGLSRLEVGRVVKAVPQPKLNVPFVDSWRDNYIDKDQC